VSSAIDAFVQISRFSDGTRRVTAITECVGMEGELVTMQDIFVFEKTGLTEQGRVTGRFRATGIRPKFYDRLRASGQQIPASVFQTVVDIGGPPQA
jgi:pilus assembly protein CpaF